MSLASALAAHTAHHNTHAGRLHIWFAAGTPRGSPLSAHAAIGAAAHAHAIGLTMHCAEAPADRALFREYYACSPLEFCARAELTGPRSVLAHVVHPDPAVDYGILAASGTTVSHNPTSNCKLGSGIAPVPEMLAAGVNVALGTDGAPCSNTYDMFREMHLAAIIHSGARQSAGVVSAYAALEMATINGARALGLEEDIGSLEVGKKADFVVVNTGSLHAAPWDEGQVGQNGGMDPVTVLVHSCTGADVEYVVVDGSIRVNKGELVGIDEEEVTAKARQTISGIRQRSKVVAKNNSKLEYI
jgi:cytosine/adenosine deaminase-related metal-dependent hydrolase